MVSVILLNYDGEEVLDRCVKSLAAQTRLPSRVVFVDNGSARYDQEKIRRLFGDGYKNNLRFKRLEKNVGYSSGMNQGLKEALNTAEDSDWIMTLSNDTELAPDFFETLETVVKTSDQRTGMIAPKVRLISNRRQLDAVGLVVSLDGMSTARGQNEPDHGQFDSDTHAFAPNGVSAVYRAAMLREIGLLDESFWAYCEDTDIGLRGWLAGWECRLVPSAVVYHARSATLGQHSLSKLYHTERNHFWVAIKCFPLPLLFLSPAFTFYRYGLQIYALLSKQGQGRGFAELHSVRALAFTTVRAIFDALKGAPRAFRERAEIKRLCRRSQIEIFRMLWNERFRFTDLILK